MPPESAPPASGSPPRRKSRDDSKRETREALIAAGVSAFAEEGLDAPSLDSICARAGYTRGAFYVHFADRDEFLIAVVASVLESFMDAIIATGDAAFDLEKTIESYVTAVASGVIPFAKGLHFHQLLAACARSKVVRTRLVEVIQKAEARLALAAAEGQGAGTVRVDARASGIATILIGLVMGVGALRELEYPLDIEAAGADVAQLLHPPR